ncbi:MAG: hypothetical protein H7221_07840, partial [Flavobacterium sp.]|nr:hypothetical protein [Flavobacterium sp.]
MNLENFLIIYKQINLTTMKLKNILLASVVVSSATIGFAQSPVSGFMSAKGKGAIAISYSA